MERLILLTSFLFGTFILVSCDDGGTIEVSDTREITALDLRPVETSPTSEQRFEPPTSQKNIPEQKTSDKPALGFTKPEGWTEKPSTMFRVINMALEPEGEVYVSQVGGKILSNVNRWYGQFGMSHKTLAEIEAGDTVSLLGKKGYLIEAKGDYNAGMGRPPVKNQMLLGAITQDGGGLVTIKLIAPPEVALREKANFKAFCESLSKN